MPYCFIISYETLIIFHYQAHTAVGKYIVYLSTRAENQNQKNFNVILSTNYHETIKMLFWRG